MMWPLYMEAICEDSHAPVWGTLVMMTMSDVALCQINLDSCLCCCQMLNPPGCQCNVCRDCLQHHFEIVIRERYVRNMVCPVCSQLDIDNSPQTDTHFQLLSIMVTCSTALAYRYCSFL